jgi:hypothetical protein
MALRLQVDGLLNAAGRVVKDGKGTTSVLALSNDSSADAKLIGAPKPGRVPPRLGASGVCDDDPRH